MPVNQKWRTSCKSHRSSATHDIYLRFKRSEDYEVHRSSTLTESSMTQLRCNLNLLIRIKQKMTEIRQSHCVDRVIDVLWRCIHIAPMTHKLEMTNEFPRWRPWQWHERDDPHRFERVLMRTLTRDDHVRSKIHVTSIFTEIITNIRSTEWDGTKDSWEHDQIPTSPESQTTINYV